MAEIKRVALFGKLNAVAYRAIEAATVFFKMRGNPYVELAHWIHQILQLQDTDLHHIVRQFNLDPGHVAKDLTAALDRLPRGSTSISDLSAHVEEAVERGWVYATLMFGEPQVRTGYLMVGILKERGLRNELLSISKEFDKIKLETLTDRFAEVVAGSPEEAAAPRPARRVARWRRRRWASRRRCASSRWISPSARARASSTRSSAATRRSVRSSTS